MKKMLIICALLVFLINSTAFARDKDEDNSDIKKNFEIQLEYFNGKIFNNRNVNNYNVHVFQQFKQRRALSIYRGITFTRATGYSKPHNHEEWLDSEGVGIGPAFMLRWKKHLSGRLYATGDFTGSLMFYNKAHPAEGRAYGFLWRLGPRLLWQYSKKDAVSLGYSISHFSNGLRSHNPGYNGLGFTLNFQHQF